MVLSGRHSSFGTNESLCSASKWHQAGRLSKLLSRVALSVVVAAAGISVVPAMAVLCEKASNRGH